MTAAGIPGAPSRLVAGLVGTLLLSACATNSSGSPPATLATPHATAAPGSAVAPARTTPALSKDLFEPAIQRMVPADVGGAPVEVLAVAGPVRGWAAAAVSPPFREFPTIILFRARQDGSWDRVFEALTPGVQPQGSGLLDLHTAGKALDYTINGGARVTADVIGKAVSISRRNQLAIVAHAFFFHGHPAGAESYFVDRTATDDLARRLFPGEYDEYPRTECTMFDVPALRRIELTATADRLLLTAHTPTTPRPG